MASYFDAQPRPSAVPKHLNEASEEAFGKQPLLSPQVIGILEDLEGESSSSEEEPEPQPIRGSSSKGSSGLRHAQTYPLPKQTSRMSKRPVVKNPRLARFHSLRSMLFSSHIEDNLNKLQDEQAEERWKQEYEQRKGLTHTKDSSPSRSSKADNYPTKSGHRRVKSKDTPTMNVIEESDCESTASDDDWTPNVELGKKHDEPLVSDDDESIDHSDMEDLVRWVSRRDPPSDGEASKKRRQKKANLKVQDGQLEAHDSGHESLGQSDVEDLVDWVSRKPEGEDGDGRLPADYSDASTASDSEGAGYSDDAPSRDQNNINVDELVRWVSRKEGANAGPVGRTVPIVEDDPAFDSDHSELGRWVTRHDDTSGESDVGEIAAARYESHHLKSRSPDEESEHGEGASALVAEWGDIPPSGDEGEDEPLPEEKPATRPPLKETLTHEDVDDLVDWVAKKQDEPAPEKETTSQRPPLKETLTHEDVDDLVRWVSRKEEKAEKAQRPPLKETLTHDDVDDLVRWVSRKNSKD
ncbi:hypothetical protein BU24DRAFT_416742 [Aaosphaeria arxii CBS 175.79]|uniref:Uncharacterized protein n=1 Tax=Aaosphaeria arxii CBS 175.79 TaxID=1450172 RepID=A0A6A5Y688_9PLEO|nr:uncharacterized protein BU24DRAFT_416742 [Aaosphaeria arxii CBS 175.79]KAF2021072.1 hypothetical protein BU24DRAFT_416742 [Aaosphaeria arxii CBS 175.79]